MSDTEIPSEAQRYFEPLLEKYDMELPKIGRLSHALLGLLEGPELKGLVHSYRTRVKERSHFEDKLLRKWGKAKEGGATFDITPSNLYLRINDLAGLRLLHQHTAQFPAIHATLTALFAEQGWEVVEAAAARVWDSEYRKVFQDFGIQTKESDGMYTSVHYVVRMNNQPDAVTGEIQVRTLAEELWGEVDHTINYPRKTTVSTCTEQIKVLARVTSSATRLVDSIMLSHREGTSPKSK